MDEATDTFEIKRKETIESLTKDAKEKGVNVTLLENDSDIELLAKGDVVLLRDSSCDDFYLGVFNEFDDYQLGYNFLKRDSSNPNKLIESIIYKRSLSVQNGILNYHHNLRQRNVVTLEHTLPSRNDYIRLIKILERANL